MSKLVCFRYAWSPSVDAFQGRTVESMIAAMRPSHPHFTTQKKFCVEISRAGDRVELVTDDAGRPPEQRELATGERISGMERIEGMGQNASAMRIGVMEATGGKTPDQRNELAKQAKLDGKTKIGREMGSSEMDLSL